MTELLLAVFNSLTAWVVVNHMTQPGEALYPLYRLVTKLPAWLHKPLISCDKCLSGQLSLWTYLTAYDSYNALTHLHTVALSIFIVIVVNKLYFNAN